MRKQVEMVKNKLDKKDLVYWVIILVGCNIFSYTGRLAHDTTLLNYISFAGTVISIILAVIAIIYSYYQSSAFENTTNNLENSADIIGEVTQELRAINMAGLTNQLQDTINTVDDKIIVLNETIHNIDSSISEVASAFDSQVLELQNVFDYFQENFQSFHSKQDLILDLTNEFNLRNSDNNHAQTENNTKIIVDSLSYFGFIFMFYIVRATQNNKTTNLIRFMSMLDEKNFSPWKEEWRKQTASNEVFLTNSGFYFAFIVQALDYKWFQQDGTTDKLEITALDSNFENAILDRMEKETNETIIEIRQILNDYIQEQ